MTGPPGHPGNAFEEPVLGANLAETMRLNSAEHHAELANRAALERRAAVARSRGARLGQLLLVTLAMTVFVVLAGWLAQRAGW